MFYLVTAFRTEHREGEPTVLYCGVDGEKAAQAVTDAGSEWQRVEKALVADSFKVRGPIAPAEIPIVQKIPRIPVPTLEEVIKAGYSEEAAKSIIACQQAKADAVEENPDITDEELLEIDKEVRASFQIPDSKPLEKMTVAELSVEAGKIGIDPEQYPKKADLLAAIQLKIENTESDGPTPL